LLNRLELIVETTAEDVVDCEKRLAYSEKALEALRSEHEVDANVVIPALYTRWGELQAEKEANIAMSNHRRAGATPVPDERM